MAMFSFSADAKLIYRFRSSALTLITMPAAGKAGPNLMFPAKDPGHPIRQVQIRFSN
jgi:hypothetical protein